MVASCSWNNAVNFRKMDNRLFVVDPQGQCQCGGEDEIGWLFEVILVTFSCLVVLGRSPLGVFARYVRGLLTFPSLILHISALYSIIYCDHSHVAIPASMTTVGFWSADIPED